MIIHISGTPGSGKTTLGEYLQKKFGSKVVVYDTDGFIQHHNKQGKLLLKLDKEKVSDADYLKAWKEILDYEFAKFIRKHRDKVIIFTGALDNFSPDGTIYELEYADFKYITFLQNVSLTLSSFYSLLMVHLKQVMATSC